MPTPNPHAGESQSDWMSRCMGNPTMGTDYPDQDQRVAVCMQKWRDRNKAAGELARKVKAAPPPGGDALEFVMSDATVDRMGDVIEQSGWVLDNFRRNPIALFNHRSDFIVGKWRDVRIEDNELRGHLELLPPVTDRQREIHAAVAAGVLRGVSVGFHPVDAEPLGGSKRGGLRYLKSELVECSLVSVPANPNALAIIKSLGLSREAQSLIFGVRAEEDLERATGTNGVRAGNPRSQGNRKMTLSERIQAAESNVVELRDKLTAAANENELDDVAIDELNSQIEQRLAEIDRLKKAERALALAAPLETRSTSTNDNRPSFAMPKKPDLKPADFLLRTITAAVIAHHQGRRPVLEVLRERYGEEAVSQNSPTRVIADALIVRAATVPATTTAAGWAAELVQIAYGEFFDALYPGAIYPALAGYGLRLNLGRNGTIQLPTRAATPTIAGSFVGEGAPIPVRQGALTSVSFGLKKMAVITTFTREIMEHSNPTIESVVREMIQQDTQATMDSLLIDAVAADTVRPPGLRFGVAVTPATAGGGFNALVGDIKNLIGVLAAANAMRRPVWIMNAVQKISVSLTQNAGGDFPFKEEINGNMLQGYPVIVSTTMPAGMVLLLDAADFVSLSGDDPRFELSDQATLHMEDTAPLPIGTPGAPATVAAPTRSMFQTDSIALRMILPMNWGMRRTGVIAWTQAVTW